jgi:hypothetical protein
VTRQNVTVIDVNATNFRVSSFCLIIVNGRQLLHTCSTYSHTHFISAARNAWVGNLVSLCVMEDRSCVEKWMVEGATALKKVCGMHNRK